MQPVILLVDDERSIRSALHRIFRKHNFQVLEADSGYAALNILENNVVDVVISDQRMPGMTGTELLTKVKEHYPEVGRIMLSGQSDFDDLCDAINEASVFSFLPKPWDEEQLLSVVNKSVPSGIASSAISTGASDVCASAALKEDSGNSGSKESLRNNKVMAAIIKEAVLRRQVE